jgi:large subunit ribosomal protein L4
MDVPVYDKQGKQVDTMSVDEAALGGEVNPALIKQAFVRYHANRRQGSARTKSRGMVQGSTRKLYRQKGTGRARPGPIRTPIRKGGGHTFAKTKTREHYRLDMPVKMRRAANRNALLAKLVDNEVKVIDDLSFDAPRTRDVVELLKAHGVDRSCLIALNPENKNARLSCRNVDGLDACPAHELNAFTLLNHRYIIIAKSDLEAWLAGPSSRTGKGPFSAPRAEAREAAKGVA